MKVIVLFIASLVCVGGFSQESTINPIDEVEIYSRFSSNYHVGNSVSFINDSILKMNNGSLAQILAKHANLYFKENGAGMLASVSLRGSGASHTAVYWNGIPINSSLNGQTDFNTFFSSTYDKISIRKGGNSSALGSGAIGGAINLENNLSYISNTSGNFQSSIGNFETYRSALSMKHSTKRMAIQIGANALSSKNDYAYFDSDISNENAEIKHYSFYLNTGYKLTKYHSYYLKALYNNSDRNTSRTLFTTNNANLIYKNLNIALGWKYNKNKYISEFKTAFLKEDYLYTFDKEMPDFNSDNTSRKWHTNYHATYLIKPKLHLQTGITYEVLKGNGTDIEQSERGKFAHNLALYHTLFEKFSYNANIRKEWSSIYKIPLVFSLNSKQQWHKQHATSFGISSNFRVPTLNDLYWEPGGNPDLIPEKNWNSEFGYEWGIQNLKLSLNAFISQSDDFIQWRPQLGSIWQPVNVQKVSSHGLEFNFEINHKFNSHTISTHLQYSYTKSYDVELKKQLIYIPYHLGNLQISYTNEKWSVDLHQKYNGSVFTLSSNTNSIDDFWLTNISVKRNLLNKRINLGFDINNLFNKNYQIVSARPMPQRNFTFLINYKF